MAVAVDKPVDIFKLAAKLRELRERKKKLQDELKEVNAAIDQCEQALAEEMISQEVQNFNLDGRTFYLSTQVYASPKADRKYELYQWLKDNGYGDMVQETVHSRTLSAFVKELLDEGELPPELAEMVNVYEKTVVGMRRA